MERANKREREGGHDERERNKEIWRFILKRGSEERVDEDLSICEERSFARLPVVVDLLARIVWIVLLDRLDLEHQTAHLDGQHYPRGGCLEALHFVDVGLLQIVEALDSFFQSGHGFSEVLLGVVFDGLCGGGVEWGG